MGATGNTDPVCIGQLPYWATRFPQGPVAVERGALNVCLRDQRVALEWVQQNSPLGPDVLKAGIDKVVSVYPDDVSAGSPFGTGDETFGASPGFKRAAAICKSP
jgi:hypothetical protein